MRPNSHQLVPKFLNRSHTADILSTFLYICKCYLLTHPYYATGRVTFPVTAGTAYAMEASTPSYPNGADVSWALHCEAPTTLTITSPAEGARFRTGSSVL